MAGQTISDLQNALQLLLKRGHLLANHPTSSSEMATELKAEQAQQFYGGITTKLVAIFQQENQLSSSGSVDEATAKAINDLLAGLGLLDEPQGGNELLVQGTVVNANGKPAAGAKVQAFDRDMRTEELLGEGATDAKGRYQIRYTAAQFTRAERDQADLLVKVVDDNGGVLAASATVFNAAPDQTINITLTADQAQGPSEYERYLAELKPLAGSITTAALTDDDLAFLTGETGIPLEHLGHLRLDAQWQKSQAVEAAAFYGLLRQGLPNTLRQLLAEKPLRWHDALKQAVAGHVVPAALGGRLDAIVKRLGDLAVAAAFKQEDGEALAPVGLVVATAPGLTKAKQEQFVRFTLGYEPQAGASFWEQAQAELGDAAAVRAVQRSLQASVLTLHHLPLLKQVQQETQGDSVKAVAAWSEKDWLAVVKRSKAHGPQKPAAFGSDEDYAAAIVKKVDAYLPSDRLVARANRTAQSLKTTAGSPLFKLYAHLGLDTALATPGLNASQQKKAVQKKLQQFDSLFASNPTLDLRHADLVRGRIAVHDQEVDLKWGSIPAADRPQVLKQARAFQRVMPLARDTETRIKLLSAGFDSSQMVLNTSAERLALTADLPVEEAARVRRAASHQATGVEVARRGLAELRFGIPLRVDNLDRTEPEAFRDLPDIQQLFGAQNFCDCAHCSSILSQSAYFVDLMAFVDQNVSSNFGELEGYPLPESALHLRTRRPDLWTLELNCKNINTQVPYLEVVNHTFEQFLIQHLGASNRDDLYQRLAEQEPPRPPSSFKQPFRPAQQELDLYLSHFSLKRADVFAVLGRPADELRLAHLNVSTTELKIIGEPDTDQPRMRKLFHVEGANNSPIRIPVPQFLRATGLSRAELTQLLNASTLALSVLAVVRTEVEGSLGQLFEQEELQRAEREPPLPQLSVQAVINGLDRIHRWLRLWRKTGWSLLEFDFVVSRLYAAGLGPGVDNTVVRVVASLKLLQDNLSLSVEELVCLLHLIPAPTAGPPGLDAPFFDAHGVMLNRLFGKEPLTGTVDFTGFDTDTPTVTFSSQSDVYRLLAGLSLSEPELVALLIELRRELDPAGSGATHSVALSLTNLSVLYRHALLARKLKRATAELFPMIRLVFGAERTALSALDDMLRLAEQAREIDALPFSLAELQWLVLGEGRDARSLQITDAQLAKLRTDLPTMDTAGLQAALGNIYGWKSTVSEDEEAAELPPEVSVVLELAGVTLEGLQAAVAAGAAAPALRDEIERIEKWRLLQINLDLKTEHHRFIAEDPTVLGATATPGLALIKRLVTYRALASGEPEELEAAHAALRAFQTDPSAAIGPLLQADPTLVASLLPGDVMALAPNRLDALAQLRAAVAMCEKIGVNGQALKQMAAESYADVQVGRDAMLGAFLAKYPDEAQRAKLLEPYTEAVLELRRNGLVDYLLSPAFAESASSTSGPFMLFRDPVDLYRFFLMDAEMDGCARTSWVLAGISSVQLYVQRCLMNLEQSGEGSVPKVQVPPSAIPQHEWAWRKNYRVWEANRRVFLYPENYLYPDLRDDKTPFFEEGVDELQQQEITQETAESAYRNYFDKFTKVANMKYAGATYNHLGCGPLYLFAHTFDEPRQYHYRTLTPVPRPLPGSKPFVWSHWHRVDLPINAEVVAPLVAQGRLHVFWVDIKTRMDNEVVGGTSNLRGYTHTIDLNYSYQNAKGTWETQTKVRLRDAYEAVERVSDFEGSDYRPVNYRPDESDTYPYGASPISNRDKDQHTLAGYQWDRVLPSIFEGQLHCYYHDSLDSDGKVVGWQHHHRIARFERSVVNGSSVTPPPAPDTPEPSVDEGLRASWNFVLRTKRAEKPTLDIYQPIGRVRNEASSKLIPYGIRAVNLTLAERADYVASIESDSFLLAAQADGSFQAHRLGTTVNESLGAVLYEEGLHVLLSTPTQRAFNEASNPWSESEVVLLNTAAQPKHIDFKGACGNYYRELYFHLPFQIADNLNASQKFAEAQRWYHYIFDPTAAEDSDPEPDARPADRNWRYADFRGLRRPKLLEMLTDPGALEQYRTDPFNPWAIARLRPSALQKAVVMKYIDNLLDWGDHLFTQDSYESINEATLLYITALDILGERPVQMGPCSAPEATTTYAELEEKIGGESEFVVLENLVPSLRSRLTVTPSAGSFREDGTFSVVPSRTQEHLPGLAVANEASTVPLHLFPDLPMFVPEAPEDDCSESTPTGSESTGPFLADMSKVRAVFCVPANEQLLGYWDRVEDRLFKIRNCMNIRGMRRALALYSPRIDPMLLVRAKAAGLSLEDVLQPPPGQGPVYRFPLLLERARGLAATVQGFGSALLSALEKKDAEELNLMRARHEQNIISLTRKVKQNQVAEAQRQRMGLEASQVNIEKRRDHFANLVEVGLSGAETMQQRSKRLAIATKTTSTLFYGNSSILALLPNLGSPFAITYGGKQTSAAAGNWGVFLDQIASISNDLSSGAGLRSAFERREDDWIFQRDTARQELRQIDQQIQAAKLREEIAERDLAIYENTVEQSQEQFDFVKDKFTKVGLYNWMAQQLTRLHRDAYLLAYEAARQAQQAYDFERNGVAEDSFIEATHWEQDKAGLLAGEKLMLQLQHMDQQYHATNQRKLEITKQISLAMLNPAELIQLRETGKCAFNLPALLFDLDFPGQYQRRIKAVRITIPCVAGPYTNVNSKLTLLSHEIRWNANDEDGSLQQYPDAAESIATSSAQGDSGMFEFNFRDERYLPFEGAGAVSKWELQLPSVFPQFDYETISDVVMHLSYTAVHDGVFEDAVKVATEAGLNDWLTAVGASEAGRGLHRVFSLRQEFGSELHRFLQLAAGETFHETKLTIDERHFPYFLRGRELTVPEAFVIVKPRDTGDYAQYVGASVGLAKALRVTPDPERFAVRPTAPTQAPQWGGLPEATFSSEFGSANGEWTITFDEQGQTPMNPDLIEDVLLVLRYTVD